MFLKAARNILVAALFVALALTVWLAKELSSPFPGPGANAFFEVEKGRSARAVAVALEKEQCIRSSLALTLACDLFYPRDRMRAGEYQFTFPLSAKEALFKIFRGKIYLHPVTIPEGLTRGEVENLLLAQAPVDAETFQTAFQDTHLISDWDPEAQDLEGYLFPDTYHVPRKATGGDLVAAIVGQFRKVFGEEWRSRAAELGRSIRDIVILASLIEKETGRPEERALVSAVFHNRLRAGMKLDCDPTIIYALKLQGKYTGRLLSRDLKLPSLYNTYLHRGLPPGPICSPGRESLGAALYPAAESYLYFVARGDGTHQFSRTIGEHLKAVRDFQQKNGEKHRET
jgi:UPF0755 protein